MRIGNVSTFPRTRNDGQPSRRRFLTGAGGSALALPWLEKIEGTAFAQQGPTLKRVITVTYGMGLPGGLWTPTATGSNFTLPYVTASLERFKSRMLMVSALSHGMLGDAAKRAYEYGHPGKAEAALTGTLPTNVFPTVNTNHVLDIVADPTQSTEAAANGPSIEYLIGRALPGQRPFRSVDLGVDGGAYAMAPGPTLKSAFSHEGPGNRVSLMMQPHLASTQLFGGLPSGPSGPALETRRLRFRNKSVLDLVRTGFNQLKQGLGSADRQRLQDHADRIRAIELDPVVTAACAAPSGLPTSASPYKGMKMKELSAMQIKVMASAMACDLAPVGRLEFQHQHDPRFGIPELDSFLDSLTGGMNWHGMVHGQPFEGSSVGLRPGAFGGTTYEPHLVEGYRFFVQEFANLLSALDAIPEGQGTSVLDNSLVILASDLGEGYGHGCDMMGYILVGNLGPARRGYHFKAAKEFDPMNVRWVGSPGVNVNQLLNSILDMAGVKDAQGQPLNAGLGGWLESKNLPRRIDALFV